MNPRIKQKTTWQLIKNFTNKKSNKTSLIECSKNDNDVDFLDNVNNFFLNVCPNVSQGRNIDLNRIKR